MCAFTIRAHIFEFSLFKKVFSKFLKLAPIGLYMRHDVIFKYRYLVPNDHSHVIVIAIFHCKNEHILW